jgi:fused signal recognition particle receptor
LKKHLKEAIMEGESFDDSTLETPMIILIVGVNGVGKTTTIGKLAHRYQSMGKKVLVAAGDTFRAAATEQLQIWCERAGVDIIANKEGSDPAAVIFDSIQAAKARGTDILICDTAGRLHNKKNLMNELNKIFRVVEKEYDEKHKQVYLVLDATTGQNGIIQAKTFKEVAKIDGIILTKLDGTAKGGIIIPVQKELNVPVKYVGLGEKLDDLQLFDPNNFVDAIFE